VGDGEPQRESLEQDGGCRQWRCSGRDGSLTIKCRVAKGWNTKIRRRTFARRHDQRHRSTCCWCSELGARNGRQPADSPACQPTSQPLNRGVYTASQSSVSHRLNTGTETRASPLNVSFWSVSRSFALPHPTSVQGPSIIGSLALRQSLARLRFHRSRRTLVLNHRQRTCLVSFVPFTTLSARPGNRWVVQQVLNALN